jgi:protein-S-isoprenylcysteine O-methyltransferase Ste14
MELIFDVLVTLGGLTALALAGWSARGHFYSEKIPFGSIIISIVILVTVALDIYLVWTEPQPLLAQLVGFVMMAAGIALFFLTIGASRSARLRMAFDEGNPRGLVQQGPYRYVRHPFYVTYIIFFSGLALATWALIAVGPVILLAVIYVLAARMEERLFAGTEMAGAYEAYRQQTGFFFPKLSSITPARLGDRA